VASPPVFGGFGGFGFGYGFPVFMPVRAVAECSFLQFSASHLLLHLLLLADCYVLHVQIGFGFSGFFTIFVVLVSVHASDHHERLCILAVSLA
jgi:hypothetical protein